MFTANSTSTDETQVTADQSQTQSRCGPPPFDNVVDFSTADRRDYFAAEITRFAKAKRDAAEAMTRDQFSAMDSLSKLVALKQGLLDNIARLYANNPDLGVDPGIITLITVLSDNHRGVCNLSIPRIAAFLSRSVPTIHRAMARLLDQGLVLGYRTAGKPTEYHPFLNKVFGSNRDSVAWLIDVYAPSQPVNKGGRPPKLAVVSKTPLSPADTGVSKHPYHLVIGVAETPLSPSQNTPITTVIDKTTSLDTTVKKEMMIDTRARLVLSISPEQSAAFNRVYNTWGATPGTAMSNESITHTDSLLIGALAAFDGVDAGILQQAFAFALNTLAANAGKARTKGGASALDYFQKVLLTNVGDARLEAASQCAKAHLAQQRFRQQSQGGVQGNPSSRRAGTTSTADLMLRARLPDGGRP